MKVNLLKGEIRTHSLSINWLEIITALIIVISIFALSGHYYFISSEKAYLQDDLNAISQRILNYNIEKASYLKLKKDVEDLEKLKKRMESLKYRWNSAISEQGYVVPEKLMLISVDIRGNEMSMQGLAENNERVLELIDNMKTSPVFQNVSLINLGHNNDTQFKIKAVISGEGDSSVR